MPRFAELDVFTLALEILDSILLKRAIRNGAFAKSVKFQDKILPSFHLMCKILGKKLCKYVVFPRKKTFFFKNFHQHFAPAIFMSTSY